MDFTVGDNFLRLWSKMFRSTSVVFSMFLLKRRLLIPAKEMLWTARHTSYSLLQVNDLQQPLIPPIKSGRPQQTSGFSIEIPRLIFGSVWRISCCKCSLSFNKFFTSWKTICLH